MAEPVSNSASQTLERVTRILVERFHPERIILFGSRATGLHRPDSDTDLLIVLRFEGSGAKLMTEMLGAIRPTSGFEIIPATPDDVARRYEWGDAFVREAIDRGIVLYERAA